MDELWKPYQPYPEPSHPEKKPPPTDVGPIRIRHPSYPDTCNTLLKFWSFDGQGAHHETVRIACAIVANNTWAGYLSTDKGGNDTVTEQPDAVLKGKTYYFHIAPPSNGRVITLLSSNTEFKMSNSFQAKSSTTLLFLPSSNGHFPPHFLTRGQESLNFLKIRSLFENHAVAFHDATTLWRMLT